MQKYNKGRKEIQRSVWVQVCGRERMKRSGDNEKEVADGTVEEKPHTPAKLQGSQCAKHSLIVAQDLQEWFTKVSLRTQFRFTNGC